MIIDYCALIKAGKKAYTLQMTFKLQSYKLQSLFGFTQQNTFCYLQWKKKYPRKWGKNFKTVNGEMAQLEIRN